MYSAEFLVLHAEYSGVTDERSWLVNIYHLVLRLKKWTSGSCWCTLTNVPLIIFIIYKPGAVWCTVTDYHHNNDGAQWMAAHWKTCFIIRMKLLPLYVAVTSKNRRWFLLLQNFENYCADTSNSQMQMYKLWQKVVCKALNSPQLKNVGKLAPFSLLVLVLLPSSTLLSCVKVLKKTLVHN